VFIDKVLSCYRRHDASDTAERVRTGVNIRERITALSMITQYLPPQRRLRAFRRGLIFAAVFATRTAASRAGKGDVRGAARQVWEAVRCLAMVPRGVPQAVVDAPPRVRGTG
jgi:hypothetical protein